MPVVVECTVNRSRLRYLYSVAPWIPGAALLLILTPHILLGLIWVAMLLAILAHLRSEPDVQRVRIDGTKIQIWADDQVHDALWRGDGRTSHAFIQWQVSTAETPTWTVRIWRDAISDASWRALNMAYRVNRAEAEATAKPV